VDKLVSMANEGNLAARYLIDRIHGQPARVSTPGVLDKTLRYAHHDWATDQLRNKTIFPS